MLAYFDIARHATRLTQPPSLLAVPRTGTAAATTGRITLGIVLRRGRPFQGAMGEATMSGRTTIR